jgi:upstream activation factor subunit UAF30
MPSAKTNATRGRAAGALAKPVQPDEALAAVVGPEPLPRTEITKRLWAYIREHNLQDPQNRRNVNADEKLRALFNGKAQVTMFELTKLVSQHVR